MQQPLTLTADDSGTTEAPVFYEAAPGAKPVFTGGVRIGGVVEQNGMWRAETARAQAGRFEQLYVNGTRAIRARSPNTWYAFSTPAAVASAQGLTSHTADLERRILTLGTTHTARLRGLSAAELSSTVLVAYHSWETSRHYVEAVDSSGTAVMSGPAVWEFHHWGARQRYHLENYRAALDAPGEWFLSGEGTLLYIPRDGEQLKTAELIAPVSTSFIRVAGEPESGRVVSHVTFKGLSFSHSAYTLPAEGFSAPQAEVEVPAAVLVDGAHGVQFSDCEFSHIGGSALWLRWGCRHCNVEHCYFHDIGAGVIKIGERTTPADPRALSGDNNIQDNILTGCGRICAGGIGVWIGRSSGNHVLHNEISDCMYTGVSVGWEWGYNRSDCEQNEIAWNRINHIGWGVLSDMGGIYTLGVSPGTTLHKNVIHDVESYNHYGAGGWGLYNDEGSSGILSENNLVYNCASTCYHQHYGQANVLRNNIFCFGGQAEIQLSKPEPHLSFVCENNIMCSNGEPLFTGRFEGSTVEFRRNLYWRYGKDALTTAALVPGGVNAFGPGSVIADPGFVDAQKFDFHFRGDTSARQSGFVPFNIDEAGVRGDAQWRELAGRPVSRPAEFPR
jgi:hypothetical protein